MPGGGDTGSARAPRLPGGRDGGSARAPRLPGAMSFRAPTLTSPADSVASAGSLGTQQATDEPSLAVSSGWGSAGGGGGFAGFMLDPNRPSQRQPSGPDAADMIADFVASDGGGGGAPSPPRPDGVGMSSAWGAPKPTAASYRVSKDVEVVAPTNFFKNRDLTYHPRSVAATLRSAAWGCCALLLFGLIVVGIALFIIHGVYGLRYSFNSGALSMEEAVVVTAEGRVGLHTLTPQAAFEVTSMPGEATALMRVSSPLATAGSPQAQRVEFGSYDDAMTVFSPTAVWQSGDGEALAMNATYGMSIAAGEGKSVVFVGGVGDSGTLTVGPTRDAKLQVDGVVALVNSGQGVSIQASNTSDSLVVSGPVNMPQTVVSGDSFLGDDVTDSVFVAGTLNVTGAIDLRRGTLMLDHEDENGLQVIENIRVGEFNVSSLNFEQKHLTVVDSLDAGPVRFLGGQIFSTDGSPPAFSKPLGGTTSVAAVFRGTMDVQTQSGESVATLRRDGSDGSIGIELPSTSANTTISVPNTDGVFVVTATSPHLSVSGTGVVTFDQAAITGTGVIQTGSIGPGFGPISTSSSINTTGTLSSLCACLALVVDACTVCREWHRSIKWNPDCRHDFRHRCHHSSCRTQHHDTRHPLALHHR